MIGLALQPYTYDISVILATHNRRDVLEKTLAAYDAQTFDHERFEIIVIDDGSTDDTSELLERVKNRRSLHFTYIKQENAGQGNARNAGLQIAEGRVIFFTGDDQIPDERVLELHNKFHSTYFSENFALLGHTTWHPDLEISPTMKFMEQSGMQFGYPALDKKTPLYEDQTLRKADYHYFYTSNISVKSSVLKRQQFHPEFSKYGWEDIELGQRLEEEEGVELYYLPEARVYHYHPMSDDAMEKRAYQIGYSAVKAVALRPELTQNKSIWNHILPPFWKRLCFQVISTSFILNFLKNKAQQGKKWYTEMCSYLYLYGIMKREYLRGIRDAQKAS